jgi:photosystem II stability/assembly factor-like uncharacterized protein
MCNLFGRPVRSALAIVLLVVIAILAFRASTSQSKAQDQEEYGWITIPSPTSHTLKSMAINTASDGWIVGTAGTILHWDGSVWTAVASPITLTLESVAMNSTGNAWAVGGKSCDAYDNDTIRDVVRYDGNAWTLFGSETIPNCCPYFTSVSTPDTTNAWMAGGYAMLIYHGLTRQAEIRHWDGNTWQTVYSSAGQSLSSIHMVSSTLGWAVGAEGYWVTSLILQWDGNTWTKVESPIFYDTSFSAIDASSGSDAWAIGGTTLHWDGTTWTQHLSPLQSGHLNSVSSLAANDAWAVGTGGSIIHWDGNIWSPVASPTTSELYSVKMLWAHEGWAAGENGTILHYGPLPTLTINYPDGQAGSFFTLSGAHYFPPNVPTGVIVNNHLLTSTLPIDVTGDLVAILDTSEAGAGRYYVTTTTNPRAIVSFALDPSAPLRAQTGSGPVIKIPSGIAFAHATFLPLAYR